METLPRSAASPAAQESRQMPFAHIKLRGVLAVIVCLATGRTIAQTPEVAIAGTGFVLTMPDGRVLRSPDLVGAIMVIAAGGRTVRVRIDDVERDPLDTNTDASTGDTVWLHTLALQQPDGSWLNPCEAGPDGRRQGFPLAGQSAADATLHPASAGTFELVCTAGAQGKCVRFGYHLWSSAPDGSPLLPVYNACVHMVRGDYAGDNSPKTRNGMLIDIYDDLGIQLPGDDAALTFEAGWSEDGAVCVHHPRVAENITLDELSDAVPRLAGRTGEVCTEEFARAHGALIYNRSRQISAAPGGG